MKIIIKGDGEYDGEMVIFFLENILPLLKGMDVEYSSQPSSFCEIVDGKIQWSCNPKVEVYVALSYETITGVLNSEEMGEFAGEAFAIRKIVKLRPSFSIEFHSFHQVLS